MFCYTIYTEKGEFYIKSHLLFFIINTLLPLILGTIVYLSLKPNAYISSIIYKWLPFHISISPFEKNILTIFIHGYFCDMLWAYAFMITLCFSSAYQTNLKAYIVIACIIFESLIELLQYLHIISGTFDLWDIILEILMNLLAIVIWKYNVKGGIKTYEKEMY